MFAYGEKPLPFTLACCEGYVQRNIHMQCMARTHSVIEEEFLGAANAKEAGPNEHTRS